MSQAEKIEKVMSWTLKPYMVARAALIECDWDLNQAILKLRYQYLADVICGGGHALV